MDDATSLGSRRLYSDEYLAIVQQVLVSMPSVRIAPADVEAAAADLTRRLIAVYPYPRQRPAIGFRAIVAAHGADSYMAMSARFLMGLHQFGVRYRGLQHREAAGLPASLVEEPNMDAAAAELLELFRLRHRGRPADARSALRPGLGLA